MASKTLLTIEEFLELDLPEDRRYELDEGEIVELTLPSPARNRTAFRIAQLLDAWNRRAQCGRVYSADTPYAIGEGILRGPDASFVQNARLGGLDESKPISGAPDLAVEVVSPSDRRSQLLKKVNQYLNAGAQEVWLVYPKTQTVWAILERDDRTLGPNDTIESPVLPGFSAKVSAFFNDPEG